MDWDLSNYVLVVLGAATSLVGSYVTQRRQAKTAKDERQEEREHAAVSTLAATFIDVRKHIRTLPGVPDWNQAGDEVVEKYMLGVREWHWALTDFLAPAQIAASTLRDESLRERLLNALKLIDAWMTLHPKNSAQARWTTQYLVEHGIECMGDWLGGKPLPRAERRIQDRFGRLAAQTGRAEAGSPEG